MALIDDLRKMTVAQLRARVKQHNIRGYTKMRKEQLIQQIIIKEGGTTRASAVRGTGATVRTATARTGATRGQAVRVAGTTPSRGQAVRVAGASRVAIKEKTRRIPAGTMRPRKGRIAHRELTKKLSRGPGDKYAGVRATLSQFRSQGRINGLPVAPDVSAKWTQLKDDMFYQQELDGTMRDVPEGQESAQAKEAGDKWEAYNAKIPALSRKWVAHNKKLGLSLS